MTTINFNQPSTGNVHSPQDALLVKNSIGSGVSGESVTAGSFGVSGISQGGIGVNAFSKDAVAVQAKSETDNGVLGQAQTSDHAGVWGYNVAIGGTGVVGLAEASVAGKGEREATTGVFGEAKPVGTGVHGRAHIGSGVFGESDDGDGVRGEAQQPASNGVLGTNTAEHGVGVQGIAPNGVGVQAQSSSPSDPALVAENDSGGTGISATTGAPSPGAAVHARNNGGGFGVLGSSSAGPGVVGVTEGNEVLAALLPRSGVAGASGPDAQGNFSWPGVSAQGAPGLYAIGMGTPPLSGDTPDAILTDGTISAIGKPAAFLVGEVDIFGFNLVIAAGGNLKIIGGNLEVTGGSKAFRIDHPLDPAHRYLRHAAVESPELKTVYDGIAELDADGAAVVTLPEWFSELNGDLRYQLTAIGAPAPNLHVAQDSDGKTLTIAGGAPKQRISWQITGVRRDLSALASPLVVEEEKADGERGRYLEPHLYGADTAMAIHANLYDMAKDAEARREEFRQRLDRT
jgi:hypothetical protein